MPTLHAFDYAVVRVVPRVEREEFVNVGVIVSCVATGLLVARMEPDLARLRALDPALDLETLLPHLKAIECICAGGPAGGPIGLLPPRARFHWLTAKRSAVIQTSSVHLGRCSDPAAAVEQLLARMVRPVPASGPGLKT